ncbi:GNAT family N-acetyltransferase [Marivibrio halodurans]|uniref:GNAT family N-acetyltransferase n=1 Tax=Marivibrio halodurans TaxID=2039722 RepID=A0A8J7V116_9PROT|nr:GNAT family N-acetyltransferase [Marivibrio halodurans]MBP5857341.1 GNAT family N-acetyltransferase [Marivibrio halodurans]
MTADDVPAAFAVRLSTVENAVTRADLAETYGVTEPAMANALASGAVAGWVAEVGGAVVGFAMGSRAHGEVLVVAVRPEHEGHGHGGRLLAAVVDWLRAIGHECPWLKANPDPDIRATGFYRRFGWRRTGRIAGEDEILVLPLRE